MCDRGREVRCEDQWCVSVRVSCFVQQVLLISTTGFDLVNETNAWN